VHPRRAAGLAGHPQVHQDDVREGGVGQPHGAKGLGELVAVGVHASIANAVYHATGIRVRELPITPDKLTALVRERTTS
jgi:xanthine dehydrogenase YagR molybdenum-binding subunit